MSAECPFAYGKRRGGWGEENSDEWFACQRAAEECQCEVCICVGCHNPPLYCRCLRKDGKRVIGVLPVPVAAPVAAPAEVKESDLEMSFNELMSSIESKHEESPAVVFHENQCVRCCKMIPTEGLCADCKNPALNRLRKKCLRPSVCFEAVPACNNCRFNSWIN